MSEELIRLNSDTIPSIANAVRNKLEIEGTMFPQQIPAAIASIRDIRTESGTVTGDGTINLTISCSHSPQMLVVKVKNAEEILASASNACVGFYCAAEDGLGGTANEPSKKIYGVANTYLKSGSYSSVSGRLEIGNTVVAVSLSSFPWAVAEYEWTAYYWDTYQSYDVSATAGDHVQLLVYDNGDGTHDIALIGSGNTADYSCGDVKQYLVENDTRPWVLDGFSPEQARNIYIGEGVEGIGDSLFAMTQRCTGLTFGNAASIRHLGSLSFYKCAGAGSYNFSGLEDEEFSDCFQRSNIVELRMGTNVLSIAESALNCCMKLRFVLARSVVSVGDYAFVCCPRLEELELAKEVRYGSMALYVTPLNDRNAKWTKQQQEELRAVNLPIMAIRVPYPEQQDNYPEVKYDKMPTGTQRYISTAGCMALSLYHAWQATHSSEAKRSFYQWWTEIVECDVGRVITDEFKAAMWEEFVPNHPVESVRKTWFDNIFATATVKGELKMYEFPFGTTAHLSYGEMLRRIGWVEQEVVSATTAEGKAAIATALSAGIPVLAGISKTAIDSTDHEVCIVGANKEGKLLVLDSTPAPGAIGTLYSIAYEDLFTGESGAANDVTILNISGQDGDS